MKVLRLIVCIALLAVTLAVSAQLPEQIGHGLATAVAKGNREAARVQAELVASGELEGDTTAALTLLTDAAQHGDAQAAYVLGVLAYRAGDIANAQSRWQQAAAGGHADAHYNLGLLLTTGGHDASAANAEFEAAAGNRHVLACYALGTRLAATDGAAARHWLECAASHGYAPAQFNLAALYAKAPRNADDVENARRWYAAAAATFAPAASALAALPMVPLTAKSPATTTAVSALSLRDHAWVMAQAGSAYTVQIASGASADVLETMLRREVGTGDAACVHEHPHTRQAYSAIVGVFPDRTSAESARAALPAGLRANNPWVRRYSALQQSLRNADKEATSSADAHAESN